VRGQRREHDDVAGASGHGHRADGIVQALPAVVGHPVLERAEAMEARHHPRHPFSTVASVRATQHVRYCCGSMNV
jgi:hypothetical protein